MLVCLFFQRDNPRPCLWPLRSTHWDPALSVPLCYAIRCSFICLSVSFFSAITPPPLVYEPFTQRDNPSSLFVTPLRINLIYLVSLFFSLAAKSEVLLMKHSNATALVFNEAKKATAKAKTNLLLQKSERKKNGKTGKVSGEKIYHRLFYLFFRFFLDPDTTRYG